MIDLWVSLLGWTSWSNALVEYEMLDAEFHLFEQFYDQLVYAKPVPQYLKSKVSGLSSYKLGREKFVSLNCDLMRSIASIDQISLTNCNSLSHRLLFITSCYVSWCFGTSTYFYQCEFGAYSWAAWWRMKNANRWS